MVCSDVILYVYKPKCCSSISDHVWDSGFYFLLQQPFRFRPVGMSVGANTRPPTKTVWGHSHFSHQISWRSNLCCFEFMTTFTVFTYLAAWKCLRNPPFCGLLGIYPLNGKQYQRNPQKASNRPKTHLQTKMYISYDFNDCSSWESARKG